MKIIFKICLCFFAMQSYAQTSFYETIKSHGEDERYQYYGEVYKTDKGKLEGRTNGNNNAKAIVNIKYLDEITTGIGVSVISDTGKEPHSLLGIDGQKASKVVQVGYPNVSMVCDVRDKEGIVAIGNYVFVLDGVSDDFSDFKGIKHLLIVDGSTSSEKTSDKKKQKKGFGKFLNKVKDRVVDNYSGGSKYVGSGPEYKLAMSKDLFGMVKNYLKEMKTKQDSYTLTSKDKADLDKIDTTFQDYIAVIKKKRNDYENSPEVQARRRGVADHKKTCTLLKENCSSGWHIW